MNADPIRHVYPPVGMCIYCGASDCPLSLEHIIPYSLGGAIELPQASCQACQRIINTYEYTCGRGIFGEVRMRRNMPTRRKRERPRFKEIKTNSTSIIRVPTSEYPAPLVLLRFRKARLLGNFQDNPETITYFPSVHIDPEDFQSFKDKYSWDGNFSIRLYPVEFARMLAKIAHSYAIAEFGIGSFEPLCTGIILGKTNDISNYVGTEDDISEIRTTGGHGLLLKVNLDVDMGLVKVATLVVDIRLWQNSPTPTYHVVVGKISLDNSQHISVLRDYLPDGLKIR